jgi:Tfp pilus assembly PilM family ATPase
MPFLTFDRKRKQPQVHTDVPLDDSMSLPMREETIAAKPDLLFGRRLSFAISVDSIELAAAQSRGNTSRLLDARRIYLTADELSQDDRASQITGRIREYVDEFGGRRPTITLLVSGQETALRMFEMPQLPPGKLRTAIAFEARKQLPFPITDCYYDYRIVSRIEREGNKYVRVSLLAITKRKLDEQLRYFELLGLEVNAVQCIHEAIGQILPPLQGNQENDNFALINIERSGTHLAYYRGENLEFFHFSSLGSNILLTRTDDDRFEQFAEMLGREIQNSLDYYTGQNSSQFTNNIYIYGDLAYSDDLIALLDDRFGFSFRRFPVERLDLTPKPSEDLLVSLPVSLGTVAALVRPRRLANLLPVDQQETQKIRMVNRLAIAALVALVIALGLTSASQYKEQVDSLREQERLLTSVQTFEQSDIFETYQQIKQRVALSARYIQKVNQEPSYIGLTFKEISRLTPAGLRLSSYEFDPDGTEFNMYLSGTIKSSTVPPELILAEYVETLSASPLYSQVVVNRHVKRAIGDSFELEFRIGMRGIV